MKITSLINKINIFIMASFFAIVLAVISGSKPLNARECSHTNFMVVDGKCINLDPQMKTEKKSKVPNPIAGINDVTGSSIKTYASLLSLVGGSAAGYKFLIRK